MQVGMGVLGWPPKVFWRATIRELYSGLEGWQKANGVEKPTTAPTTDELREMMEKFPDKKAPTK